MADTNTIIGESILIKGNLEGDEDLTIQGRVEGSVNLSKTLIVEPSGVIRAEARVANAVISGVMVGNLAATDSVEITESGRMVGDIQSPRVIINEGALFKGQVDMGDLDMPRPESTSKPIYRPTSTPIRREPVRQPVAPPPKPEPKPVEKPAPKAEPKPKPKPVPVKPAAKTVSKSTKKKVVVKKKKR